MQIELINRSRKGWVDALRGLAILLVMYGHCVKNLPEFFIFTSPVKMPLFFAITGYFFTIVDTKKFFSQLLNKVIIPWLFLGILPSVVMIPLKGLDGVLTMFLDMLSGKELWFFPCFIIGETIYFITLQVCKKPLPIILISFLLFTFGLALHYHGWLNYAMFNRAMTVQPFFLIGYLFRKYEGSFVSVNWFWICLGIFIYILLCCVSILIFPGQTMDVHACRYYNMPFCLLLVFLGCLLLFTTGAKTNYSSWIMSFIGQNTLVFYIWHIIVIAILVKGLSFVGWQISNNWWTVLIYVAWACIICGLSAILLNRYLPFAVGKKRIIK